MDYDNTPELRDACLYFKLASNPARLKLLLCLSEADGEWRTIARLDPHIEQLQAGGLVSRRKARDRQSLYRLTEAGSRIIAAYRSIRGLAQSPEWTPEPIADVAMPTCLAPSPERSPQLTVHAAALLNHAANPIRLRILLLLVDGEMDAHELAEGSGDVHPGVMSRHVGVLREGRLVTAAHRGRRTCYALSNVGLTLVQAVRATCGRLAVRRGRLTLLPDPILQGEHDALDPTSPDGLAVLFRTFAHPLRLRILNLLSGSRGVCACQLEETLHLTKWELSRTIEAATRPGLVLESDEGGWPHYRLARAANDLHGSLVGCFGDHLADLGAFQEDRSRLRGANPCRDLGTSPPTGVSHPEPAEGRRSAS